MSHPVEFHGTKAEAVELIRSIPALLAGRVPDPFGVARRVQLRVGVALLSQVQQDFITKSRGEVGRDGIQWPPLKPETIARRRVTAKERKAAGLTRANKYRGNMTAAQDAAWRKRFWEVLRGLRLDLGDKAAKAAAARAAWALVKEKFGYKTQVELFGGRQVDILRDTGDLFRSLTPGVDATPSGAEGQLFEATPGGVRVGTNRKPWHHKGVAGKLPARPLWPLDGSIPPAWRPALNDAASTGVAEVAAELLRSAK